MMLGEPQSNAGILVHLRVLEPDDTLQTAALPPQLVPETWKTVSIPLLQAAPRCDGHDALNALCMTTHEPAECQPELVLFTSKNAVAVVSNKTDLLSHWAAGATRCAAVGAGTHHALRAAWPASAASDRILPVCAEPGIDPILCRYVLAESPQSTCRVFVLGTPGGTSQTVVNRWMSPETSRQKICFYGVYALELCTQGAHQLRELCAAHENQSGAISPRPLILHCRSGTVVRAAAHVLSEGKLQPVPFSVWGASARAAALELGLPIWTVS